MRSPSHPYPPPIPTSPSLLSQLNQHCLPPLLMSQSTPIPSLSQSQLQQQQQPQQQQGQHPIPPSLLPQPITTMAMTPKTTMMATLPLLLVVVALQTLRSPRLVFQSSSLLATMVSSVLGTLNQVTSLLLPPHPSPPPHDPPPSQASS
jgi:hypothetical protein